MDAGDHLDGLFGTLLDDVPSGEDAWPAVEAWIDEARNDVVVEPASGADPVTLAQLGLTSASVVGAVALHTAGIWVDRGWVRIHGARLLAQNPLRPVEGVLIAHDAVGGRFALDAGGLLGIAGEVVYRPAGARTWQSMDRTVEDWLRWLLDADLDPFYGDVRWPGWQDDVIDLAPDDALRLTPAPWTAGWSSAQDARRERVSVQALLALAV